MDEYVLSLSANEIDRRLNMVTETEERVTDLEAAGYQTEADVKALVPTKVSQLVNDAGYMSEEDMAEYAKTAYVDEQVGDVVNYANGIESKVEGLETEISQNTKGYQTEAQVNALISAAVGDVEGALDAIIAIQNTLIGGNV